ncbi:HDOD domain-containing protein [Hydrogenophaga sp. PAMC20947]|uniref:HDOD domain-containing protein n=1 Tax=Hydrogenophaga sp. PAMC20947 TaxID=2565558 RepID=UPI001448649B|nr:HDOD domain-containing protein [Hydrogenophaga sp. PAMC20947]
MSWLPGGLHMIAASNEIQLTEPPDSKVLARCIGELPALPLALMVAVQALSSDDLPASACVDAVERDQSLAVRLLRLANSAFYGARGHVASVEDAVGMLGLRTVASVVAAVSMRSTLALVPCNGFCFETYWRHALTTAILARELARQAVLDPGEAFLAGLLHDVGQLLLVVAHADWAERALQMSHDEQIDLCEAERRLIGVGHDEVGAEVMRHWHFPERLVDAVAAHHVPLPASPGDRMSLSALVHLADLLAHHMDAEDGVPFSVGERPDWDSLCVDEAFLSSLLERTKNELSVFESA